MEDRADFAVDSQRRSRVRALIDSAKDEAAGSAALARSKALRAASVPDSIPGYELLNEIHRGGQGVVYQARQRATGRTVAVKIMRDGPFGGSRDRARFEREVHVLAQLEHPNIVGVLDSGTAGGSAYFVMDHVQGVPFDQYVQKVEKSKSRKVETQEGLGLFVKVCDAVHAAHLRGVIHCDLKPSNVLVDAAGEPHILDFGLAKLDAASHSGEETVTVTAAGHFVGSLPWASPEQAAGASAQIDLRTDVYSLGVMFYQTLTGRFPYSVVASMRDVLDHIMTAEPAPMRAAGFNPALFRMRGADAQRKSAGVNPAARLIDDELETIVLKCLAKGRERRYQSAGELARDLRHYLADEPIEAKRDSGWYVLRKTLQRYRRPVAVVTAFMVLVTAAMVALSILYARQRRLTVEVARQRDLAEYESLVANIAAAGAAIAASDGGAALARLHTVPPELRNWEWHYLIRQADQSVATYQGPQDLITGCVRLSPEGRYVGASFWMEDRVGALRVWRRSFPDAVAEIALSSAEYAPFEFLGDGNQLLFCQPDGVSRYDLTERRQTGWTPLGDGSLEHWPRTLSPNGQFLLAEMTTSSSLWDTRTGRRLHELPVSEGTGETSASFNAATNRLAMGFRDGRLVLWDVASGLMLTEARRPAPDLRGIALSPDERVLATSGESGRIELWELIEEATPTSAAVGSPSTREDVAPVGRAEPPCPVQGQPALALRIIRQLHCGDQRVGAISFSPDSKLLAAPSEDKAVRIWDVHDGTLQSTLLGHTTGVGCTAFSSDGRFLVSGAREGEVKLWDLEKSPTVRAFREFPGPLNSIAFTPDGARLFIHTASAACVVDVASGHRLHEIPLAPTGLYCSALPGPNGSQATLADRDGSIRIWEFDSKRESRGIGMHKSTPGLAGDPSGRVLASANAEAVILWDWAEGRESRRFAGPGEAVRSLALSHDASRLALGLKTGELVICDTRTGESRRAGIERGHSRAVASAAFSPDGRNLATGSDDGTVKLWDVATGRVVWSASAHLGDVWCVAFSPDGTRLAVGGRDRSVRLFDAATGRELLALRGPTGTVMCVAFSPDGRSIAAGSWAREVFIWDADPTADVAR